MNLLEVKDLQVRFRNFELNVPYLALPEGKIIAIMGRNGSGKSTFLKAIVGLQKYQGAISLMGKDMRRLSPEEIAKHLGYVSQQVHFSFPFSVAYVLSLIARRFNSEDYLEDVVYNLLPTEILNKKLTHLSFGQYRLVSIALAVLKQPKVILLDEPTLGLDAWNKRKIMKYISKLRDNGCGVLLVTHDFELIGADESYLMRQFYNRKGVNISVLKKI